MDAEQGEREQRDVAVEPLDHEARPAGGGPGGARRWRSRARRSTVSSSSVDRAGGARQVPEGARSDVARAASGDGREHVRRPAGGQRDRSVVRDEARGQAGRVEPGRARASPRMIAVVLAMLASTQDAAATLTVRQRSTAGAPGRGVEDVVDLGLAAPPAAHASCSRSRGRRSAARSSGPAPWPAAAWSSVTCTAQPPAGAVPAVAMSPPMLTSTPPAIALRRGGGRQVGGQRLGGRAEVEFDAGAGSRTVPWRSSSCDAPPARRAGEPHRSAVADRGEVAVVAGDAQRRRRSSGRGRRR